MSTSGPQNFVPHVVDNSLIALSSGEAPSFNPVYSAPSRASALVVCLSALLNVVNTSINTAGSLISILNDNTSHQNALNLSLLQTSLVEVPALSNKGSSSTSTDKIYENQAFVQNAQALNQQITAQRAWLSQKISLVQNGANVRQTQINTNVSEILQSSEAATYFLSTILALTYNALCTIPPQ
ncbi:Uncharacterized protein CLAVI_000037 [Candidatus Clavichlamydia salmonicola]|uniref:DUF720 domain-containing protein n=1 Tax=Candidatus Clavichlamydia salmonicola TaxID=469812 RepID=UPI001890FAA4|nr:DUF720 domain-containing protein [Candidatus Clavichlamydia salmonicola]MBF5050435.1 Uncharacterized protein [Candidatus Clavichlamydia salmonicola]